MRYLNFSRGYYSRAATISFSTSGGAAIIRGRLATNRGRRLIAEIRYVSNCSMLTLFHTHAGMMLESADICAYCDAVYPRCWNQSAQPQLKSAEVHNSSNSTESLTPKREGKL